MSRELTAEKAKMYLEDSFAHIDTGVSNQNPTKRAFALKKDQFQDFLKTDQNKLQNSQQNEMGRMQLIPQITEEVFSVLPPSPEKTAKVNIPPLPSLIIPEPMLTSIEEGAHNQGINNLDRMTQRTLNDADEFDTSLSLLLASMQEVEKNVIKCENLSKVNKVMSSTSLRQLTQIHADHSNDQIIPVIRSKLVSFVERYFTKKTQK